MHSPYTTQQKANMLAFLQLKQIFCIQKLTPSIVLRMSLTISMILHAEPDSSRHIDEELGEFVQPFIPAFISNTWYKNIDRFFSSRSTNSNSQPSQID